MPLALLVCAAIAGCSNEVIDGTGGAGGASASAGSGNGGDPTQATGSGATGSSGTTGSSNSAGASTGSSSPAGGSTGSGSTIDPRTFQVCDVLCACVGCSEPENEECIDDLDDQIDDARARGCGDQVDPYLQCLIENGDCVEGEPDFDDCEPERQALSACLD